MLDYLGFPHQQEDVTKFISAVDKAEPDGAADGKISPEEFLQVVGKFGGCCKLFETRGWPRSELYPRLQRGRKQIEARGTDLDAGGDDFRA